MKQTNLISLAMMISNFQYKLKDILYFFLLSQSNKRVHWSRKLKSNILKSTQGLCRSSHTDTIE